MSCAKKFPDINEVFLSVIEPHVAGDPMNEKIKYSTFVLCLGLLVFISSCQERDNNNGFNQNNIDKEKITSTFSMYACVNRGKQLIYSIC